MASSAARRAAPGHLSALSSLKPRQLAAVLGLAGLLTLGAAAAPSTLAAPDSNAPAAARGGDGQSWDQLLARIVPPPSRRPPPHARFSQTRVVSLYGFPGVPVMGALGEGSPEVAAARATIERASLGIRAAKADAYPDLFLTGGARYNRERRDGVGLPPDRLGWQGFVEAGISIPIFNRNQGSIAASEAELRVAEAELRRLELDVRGRFATAMSRYRNAARVSEAYRTEIIPRAEEAYRLYLEKYQEMQAAYPQVLIARRTMLQSSLDYIAALEELYRAGLPLRGLLVESMH